MSDYNSKVGKEDGMIARHISVGRRALSERFGRALEFDGR